MFWLNLFYRQFFFLFVCWFFFNVYFDLLLTQFSLNDTRFMLTVHWAGEGSDVVVCLSRNPAQNADTSSSVYVSYDYGRTFIKKDHMFVLPSGKVISIGRFYNHPKVNSHVSTWPFEKWYNQRAFPWTLTEKQCVDSLSWASLSGLSPQQFQCSFIALKHMKPLRKVYRSYFNYQDVIMHDREL